MISLLLKLLLAHTIGDFVLQSDKWVKGKKKKKHLSKHLYFHILIHGFLLLLALGFNWNYWPFILIIIGSHFIIDLAKLHLETKKNARILFALDQITHISIILILVNVYEPYSLDFQAIFTNKVLLFLLALIFTTSVSSIFMKLLMSQWTIENDGNQGLPKAGKYIGILERLFVFGFIVLNQWQAIGLLIAAKSVFRFGDISKAKDRKLTEYILIGTLCSFGMAILFGLCYKYLVGHV